jgi:hypothetical protein
MYLRLRKRIVVLPEVVRPAHISASSPTPASGSSADTASVRGSACSQALAAASDGCTSYSMEIRSARFFHSCQKR